MYVAKKVRNYLDREDEKKAKEKKLRDGDVRVRETLQE
jgi:hypothetical protein